MRWLVVTPLLRTAGAGSAHGVPGAVSVGWVRMHSFHPG